MNRRNQKPTPQQLHLRKVRYGYLKKYLAKHPEQVIKNIARSKRTYYKSLTERLGRTVFRNRQRIITKRLKWIFATKLIIMKSII